MGSAIALQLLFGLPLLWGVGLTAADTLLLLALQRFGIRRLEALVIALVALVGRLLRGGDAAAPARLGPGGPGLSSPGRQPQGRAAAVSGRRHSRGHGDAPQPLSALLAGAIPPLDRRPGGTAQGPGFQHLGHPDRPQPGLSDQCLDPGAGRRQLLRTATAAGHGPERGLPAADADAGHLARQRAVRRGPAGGGPELHAHRHHGRPDRDGGVPADPAAGLEAATAHPRPGPDSGDGHGDPVRRAGHHQSAGAEPGGAVAAVALRSDPAGVVLRAARPDGRAQSAALRCRSAGWLCASVIVMINLSLLSAVLRGG